MLRFLFFSLRIRLILLVLLAVLPALGLTLYTNLEQRRLAAADAQAGALRLARLASADQEHLIESTRQLLRVLAQLPAVRRGDSAACNALFAGLQEEHGRYTTFGAAEPDGDVFCSGEPLSSPVNFADRDWFRRALETRDFVVGEYVIGRITGNAVLPLAYPVPATGLRTSLDEAGQVQTVVFTGLDLAWLNQLAAQAQLPEGSAFTVLDRNGTILARYPDPEPWVGQSLPEVPIIETILTQGEGTAELPGVDNIPRLFAFTSLHSAPGDVYVSVGIPSQVAFADVNRALARNLTLLGLVTALVLVLAWVGGDLFVLRRVNALLSATKRLTAGDLSARIDTPHDQGELGQLACAFNQMATSLEQRAAERKQAEEALRESEKRYRDLYEEAPIAYYSIGVDGRIRRANRYTAEMSGYPVDDLVGRPVFDLYADTPAGKAKAHGVFQRFRAGEEIRGEELEWRTVDGRSVWISLTVQPVQNAEGQTVESRAMAVDITERRRAEEELRRRVAHQEALNTIIAAATTAEALPDLLRIALDHTLSALGLEMGAIWLRDEHVIRGLPPEAGLDSSRIARAAGLVIPGPIAIEDWQQVPEGEPLSVLAPFMAHLGIRASLTVPNIINGQRIGGLSLASPEPRRWSPDEIALVQAVGQQLGAAAERLRLLQRVQDRAERMVRLASLSEALNRPLSIEEVLEAVGEGALALSDADRGAVYVRNPDDSVVCPWFQGLSPEYVAQVTEHTQEMPGGRLLKSPEPVFIPDVKNLPEVTNGHAGLSDSRQRPHGSVIVRQRSLLRSLARAEGYQAVGLWPLTYKGRVLAAVGCYYDAPHTWSRAEQEVMQAFTRQAAVALENARLYAAEQTRRQELDALYGLSRQLVVTDEMEAVLNTVARHAATTVHTTFCRVLTLEADGTLICRAAHPVRLLERDLGVGRLDPELARSHYQRVLRDGEPLVLQQDSPALGAEERQALLFDLVHSLCLAPLKVDDEAIGLLMLGEARSVAREPFDTEKLRLITAIADQAASAIHRARLHEQTERSLQRLAGLREVDMTITASLDLRATFNVLLNQVTSQLGIDAAAVLLLDPHTRTLEYAAGRGFRSKVVERSRLRLGDGYAGRAALERRPISISHMPTAEPPFLRAQLVEVEGFIAYQALPLIAKGQVKGVLEVFHRTPLDPSTGSGQAPDPEWLDFLEALAAQAAIAIDNAELFDNLQRSNAELTLAYDTTLEGWARALELRDMETEGHSRRVTEMTLRLARAMGVSDEELVQVRRGALLHDIGKMGIPDSILLKPGPLDDDEWEIMRRHPVYAYQWLSPIAFLRPALDIPYYHHEKLDGTGYPRGLKGEQIPLAARIFAVVDVYDALRSDRPYRDAWPEEKVREYIREQAGRHFDPELVKTFLEIV